MGDGGPGWWGNMSSSNISAGHYSLTFDCTNSGVYVQPGETKNDLYFFTYVPSTNCVYMMGNTYGRALTVSNSWIPTNELGRQYIGPIDVTHQSGIGTISSSNDLIVLTITNTCSIWNYEIEQTMQLDETHSWVPSHSFSTDTVVYVFTETPSNNTSAFRLKSIHK